MGERKLPKRKCISSWHGACSVSGCWLRGFGCVVRSSPTYGKWIEGGGWVRACARWNFAGNACCVVPRRRGVSCLASGYYYCRAACSRIFFFFFLILVLGAITARRLRVCDAGADLAMARLITRSQFSVAPLVWTLFIFLFVSHVQNRDEYVYSGDSVARTSFVSTSFFLFFF